MAIIFMLRRPSITDLWLDTHAKAADLAMTAPAVVNNAILLGLMSASLLKLRWMLDFFPYLPVQLVSFVTKLPPQMAWESQAENAFANCCMSFSVIFPVGVTK